MKTIKSQYNVIINLNHFDYQLSNISNCHVKTISAVLIVMLLLVNYFPMKAVFMFTFHWHWGNLEYFPLEGVMASSHEVLHEDVFINTYHCCKHPGGQTPEAPEIPLVWYFEEIQWDLMLLRESWLLAGPCILSNRVICDHTAFVARTRASAGIILALRTM